MRLFHLYRAEDESGVSGTGPVVEGVEFTNGWCAIRWLSAKSTLCFYQSMDDVRQIHGHGGKTELIVHDFEPLRSSSGKGGLERPEFELFLQLVEEASGIITRVETSGASCQEIHQAVSRLHRLLDRLEQELDLRAA